jgi:hypothetical protein
MGTKNILAYFKTEEDAEKVARQLQDSGVKDVSIDRFSKYPEEGTEEFTNPIQGKITGLPNLTQDTEIEGQNARILAAAGPDASGMADGQDSITGYDVLLVVVVEENQHHRALQIIQDAGGRV